MQDIQQFKVFPSLYKTVTRGFYNLVSYVDRDENVTFMNYGYISLDSNSQPLELSPKEEIFKYQIQLYHYIASAIDWTGLDALEVGSGRGGGAWYLAREMRPANLCGLDLAPRAVDFCQRRYGEVKGLSFREGNAESLPFPAETLDIVLNIESSLYYQRIERFFSEVARVLKPGGSFLYADLRPPHQIAAWRAQLNATELRLEMEEDITGQVREALELDQERKRDLINRHIPKPLHFPFHVFAGLDGKPNLGDRIYLFFHLRKI